MTIETERPDAPSGTVPGEGAGLSGARIDPHDVMRDAAERAKVRSTWTGDIEDTDLERRVLAHERILQVLIAQIGETQPKFIERLRAIFSETASRREHDYTDTHAYADQFVQEIDRLLARRGSRDADGRGATGQVGAASRSSAGVATPRDAAVTVLQIFHVSGIWSVTRNNRFYGHYLEQRPAFDAVEEAALEIVANGGMADVVWHGPSPEGSVGAIRKREYRP